MNGQFHRKEVEMFWNWNRLGFTWHKFLTEQKCEKCDFTYKTIRTAKQHSKIHEDEK